MAIGKPANEAPETEEASGQFGESFFLFTIGVGLAGSYLWVIFLLFCHWVWYPALSQMVPVNIAGSIFHLPLFDLISIFPVALLVGLVGKLIQITKAPPRLGYAMKYLVVLLVGLSFVIMIPGVHTYAKLVLALGLSVQVTRWLHTERIQHLMKWGGPILAILALVMSSCLWLVTPALESRAIQAVGQNTQTKNPLNVLIVVLDTVRAESMSLYGYDKPTTPFLEKLASECLVFDRAIAPCSWTLPTHASMFSGRLPHELQAGFLTPLDGKHRLLAESLREQGYATAGIVANFVYCGKRTGLQRGMIHYQARADWPAVTDQRTMVGRLLAVDLPGQGWIEQIVRQYADYDYPGRRRAASINEAFFQWLDRKPTERPFFGFLNYFDAHAPFDPLPDYLERLGLDPPADDREKYDACLAYIDDQLKSLVKELSTRNLLDSTLLVITSDHGEHFGEHGMDHHGNTLYSQLIHVPLMIRVPNLVSQEKSRIHKFVTLQDLPHNLLEIIQLPDKQITGNDWSLVDGSQETDDGTPSKPILCELQTAIRQPKFLNAEGPMVSLMDKRGLHYIKNFGKNNEQLFDWRTDPRERTDISDSKQGQEEIAKFREWLMQLTPDDLEDRLNK